MEAILDLPLHLSEPLVPFQVPTTQVQEMARHNMFGGKSSGANATNYMNDVWVYNTTLSQWAWISGKNTVNDPGNYTLFGNSSAFIAPAARSNMAFTVDSNNILYIHGGQNSFGNFFANLLIFRRAERHLVF